jgi:hypothetical protein
VHATPKVAHVGPRKVVLRTCAFLLAFFEWSGGYNKALRVGARAVFGAIGGVIIIRRPILLRAIILN